MTPLLQHQLKFSRLLTGLLQHVHTLNLEYKLLESLRSDEQAIIHAMGEANRQDLARFLESAARWHGLAIAISNNNRTTGIIRSLHRLSLAVDLALFTPDGRYLDETADYQPLGEWWEQQDPACRWGGRFGDPDHFSLTWQGIR